MTTLTLQVESPSVLAQLKAVLKTMKGVRVLSHGEALAEEEIPNAVTFAAMKEAESGKELETLDLEHFEDYVKAL